MKILLFLIPCIIILCVFFIRCSSSRKWTLSEGQQARTFEKTVKARVHGQFLLFLPKDFEKDGKRWPLIIFLHGSGERGNDLEQVKINGIPKIVDQQPDFPFIVVSPQLPAGSGWSPFELNVLLEEVLAKLPVDQNRIYLTGLSMGGIGTWAFATEYPEKFAAIAPVSGSGDTDRACSLKNVPIWAFHGAKDDVIMLKLEEDMVNAVKECGGNVKFTVYPDAGHDAWTETYANPELYNWFLMHKKQ
jgi:predicted peptidase